MKNLKSLPQLITCLLCAAAALTHVPAQAATLNRGEAVAALMSAGSGVTIDTSNTAVWSPFVDFGGGPGNEGLLPIDARIDPHELGWLPFPGPGMTNTELAYFFWLDDLPDARFQHPTRFVLVRADVATPTLANGGIRVSDQGWWPRITIPPSNSREYFFSGEVRDSSQPPAVSNPDGLIAGPGYLPPAPEATPESAPGPSSSVAAAVPANSCGLIILGDNDFKNDVGLYERDLTEVHGVPAGRVIKANGGAPATSAHVTQAITTLCGQMPPCDKIYIRVSSHGSIGGICLADGTLASTNLCKMLQMLAAKGVPICLMIDACHSASLFDAHNWNFPAGSVVIVAANTNEVSYGHPTLKYTNQVDRCVTNSLFSHAFSLCLRDKRADSNGDRKVSDPEAYAWVLTNRPCYTWTGNNKMRYPGGLPAGGAGANANPGIRTVGANPTNININVCNATAGSQTDFHIIFKGDVRGGVGIAWGSDANDHIGGVWDGNPTITYDPARDETMVCYGNAAAPVPVNGYIHFGYFRREGGLRPARQGWGSAILDGPLITRVPSAEKSFRLLPGQMPLGVIRVASRGIDNGGWGQPLQGSLAARFLFNPISLEDLNLGNPAIAGQTPMQLGTVSLAPDTAREFEIPLPAIPPGQTAYLVLETRLFWQVSNNQSVSLELFPITPPLPAAEISISLLPDRRVSLSWTGNGLLQGSLNVDGPWEDMRVTGQPVILPAEGPRQFFRLQTAGLTN